MPGRTRLVGGFSKWLADHRSPEGWAYRRFLQAGIELLGRAPNGSASERIAVESYARAQLLASLAEKHWAQLVHMRLHGKGRRPTEQRVERAARRCGLQAITVKECEARLAVLAAKRGAPDLAARMAQHHAEPK